MGLELNLISFISYILIYRKSDSIESSIIYFLTQTIASILFLFSIIFHLKIINFTFYSYNIFQLLLITALLTKIGTAPIHF